MKYHHTLVTIKFDYAVLYHLTLATNYHYEVVHIAVVFEKSLKKVMTS